MGTPACGLVIPPLAEPDPDPPPEELDEGAPGSPARPPIIRRARVTMAATAPAASVKRNSRRRSRPSIVSMDGASSLTITSRFASIEGTMCEFRRTQELLLT
jgi:hypothetical protein